MLLFSFLYLPFSSVVRLVSRIELIIPFSVFIEKSNNNTQMIQGFIFIVTLFYCYYYYSLLHKRTHIEVKKYTHFYTTLDSRETTLYL